MNHRHSYHPGVQYPQHPMPQGIPQAYSTAPGYYPNQNQSGHSRPQQQVSSSQPGQMYPANYPYPQGPSPQHHQPTQTQQQGGPPTSGSSRQTTANYYPPSSHANNYFGQ